MGWCGRCYCCWDRHWLFNWNKSLLFEHLFQLAVRWGSSSSSWAELSWAEQSGAERVVGACQEIAPQYRTELDFVCDSMPRYDLRSRCRSQSFTCFSFLCKTNYRSHFKRCSFICMQFVAQWVCVCVRVWLWVDFTPRQVLERCEIKVDRSRLMWATSSEKT